MNINPELSESEFQDEYNQHEILDNKELNTNQSTYSENKSSLSKDISAREYKNLEFENFSHNNSNLMISDKNLILSHISNNKCYSTHSNSQDCRSIMNHLENENKSSKTTDINYKQPKKGNQDNNFEFGSQNNYSIPHSNDDVNQSQSINNDQNTNNQNPIQILKPKYIDKETNLQIRFLENILDITKFNSKNLDESIENCCKSYNSNKKINTNNFENKSEDMIRVTSSYISSQSPKNNIIKKIKIEKNYFYESDTDKNADGEIKELQIDSKSILTPNFDSGEKDFIHNNKLNNEYADSIEDVLEHEKENNLTISKNKKDENECSLSFKSFKS